MAWHLSKLSSRVLITHQQIGGDPRQHHNVYAIHYINILIPVFLALKHSLYRTQCRTDHRLDVQVYSVCMTLQTFFKMFSTEFARSALILKDSFQGITHIDE